MNARSQERKISQNSSFHWNLHLSKDKEKITCIQVERPSVASAKAKQTLGHDKPAAVKALI
jgi:hypothetical protein